MTAVLPGRGAETLDFAVEGMTCGSCAAPVQRTLERLAALGLLDPILAGAATGLSSVSVVADSLRPRRFRR